MDPPRTWCRPVGGSFFPLSGFSAPPPSLSPGVFAVPSCFILLVFRNIFPNQQAPSRCRPAHLAPPCWKFPFKFLRTQCQESKCALGVGFLFLHHSPKLSLHILLVLLHDRSAASENLSLSISPSLSFPFSFSFCACICVCLCVRNAAMISG